jgi:hypothetical protein
LRLGDVLSITTFIEEVEEISAPLPAEDLALKVYVPSVRPDSAQLYAPVVKFAMHAEPIADEPL